MSKCDVLGAAGIASEFREYVEAKKANKNFSATIENVRFILGLFMMFAGLYFGFFTTGAGESLGILSVMASPFVMVTDK